MIENNMQQITLQAYDIENEEMGKAYSDLMEKLTTKLSIQKEMAGDRRMKLSDESSEEDLLSDYAVTERYVFGVMWRIAPKKDVPSIPEGLFEHEKIQINEIQDKEGVPLLVHKGHYYFAVNRHFLVTNLPKSRIKSLQTYLNWLLEAIRGDKLYSFTPKIEAPAGTPLRDIKNIVFTDPALKKKDKKAEKKEDNAFKVFNFAAENLLRLLEDIPDLNQMLEKKILSASLLVKFSKPAKMEEEDYEKLLGAYMKPIGDSDGVTFKLKNGKKISGTDILLTKSVNVEKLESGVISEPNLIQEMEQFLRELNQKI